MVARCPECQAGAVGLATVGLMRAVIQRVAKAGVSVEGHVVGEIGSGLCVFVGVTHQDTSDQARKLADKLWKLRIFADGDDKMNLSVADVGGHVLVVSQFTLYGDARKGNRPGYTEAARPDVAEPLIDLVAAELSDRGCTVATGVFGADMQVEMVNDGPVTILLEV